MIHIQFDRNKNGIIQAFTMKGHADAGPYGKDLVCAGASAVAFGTVNAIAAICDTELIVNMNNDGGYLHCLVPKKLDHDTHKNIQLLLEGMLISMQTMEDQYSQFIKVKS